MKDNTVKVSFFGEKTARSLAYAALCLALCMVLPFLTGQIPQIGSMLSPMHIPVFLAGFLCGPWWAAAVGAVAPLLRHVLFGMPPFPTAFGMCTELLTYGLVCGLLYRGVGKRKGGIYLSLISAMLAGRIVWGVTMKCILAAQGGAFTWAAFLAGAFTKAVPGIILHIVLIPAIVMALERADIIKK